MINGYLTRGWEVAAALHAVADDFALLPDEDLPDLSVTVNVQVCQHSGTGATRAAAVDLLLKSLLDTTGRDWVTDGGTTMRSTPYDGRCRDGIAVEVYSQIAGADETVSADVR
jgi:hypothetical protein